MFSDFRRFRGGVFVRAMVVATCVVILFVAGCTTNKASQQLAVVTTSAQLPAGQINVAYAQTTLTAANGTSPFTWSVTGGALPSGMTLSSAGVLAGTPTASGNFSFTVQVTDSATPTAHTATASLSLKVNQPPAITSTNSATFTVGAAGTFTVAATGFPAPTFSETGTLPNGVTLNATTGVLSGTPAAGTGGTYSIAITAQNGATPNATQSFTLTVNEAPAITSSGSTSFIVATAGSFTVTASGFPAPTLSETGALPTGVTFNAATGVLAGTPAGGTQKSYPITFTAQNGIGTNATQNFILTVGLAPAITSGAGTTFTVGTAGTFTVTATGFPAPTFSETGALPSGVTLNATTGVLSGTPGAGTGKAYPITITATNGVGANATQNFTLTVNQAPSITSGNNATFTVGSAGTFTVTATGFPAPTFSETGSLPSGVTLNSATGALSGTPASGSQGNYPITITAQNGVGINATQAFTLTVGLAPAITSGNNTTFTVGSLGTFTVTATGFPTSTFSETGSLPSGVSLNATTGVLSGTPASNTGGTYPITITAQNGITPNATQSFTLTVNQAPSITSVNNTTFVVGNAGSFQVTATGMPAPTFSETGALPTGVSLAPSGALTGTPAAGTQGSYPIVITASNGISPNATQAFTLTVNVAPAITSGNSTTFTVGTVGTFTVTATGLPAPTFSETGALPAGVTLNSSTGALSGTPGPNTGGTYPITITAQNGITPNATQSFTLTVDQAPAVTSANNTTFAVGSNNTFTVTASGFPAPTLSETGTLPSGVTFNSATGVLSGIPASGTQTSSPYSITFTAQNGVGTNANQSFTLNVSFTAPPTITSSNNTTFTVGTLGSFTVTANGAPAPTFSETGALPNGVTLNPTTGALSGTPAAGTGGSYPITITAQNGISPNASQSFTLTVDQAPAITSVNNTTFTVGTSGAFQIVASGFPAPTFSETGTLPTGVTLSPSGLLSGTPASGMQGSYPITVTAQNGVTPNATQSFTLTVNTAPAITSSNNTTFIVGTAGTFTVTATGTPAPTLGESGTLPNGLTFNPATGVLGGTPATGTGGNYSITFTANNGVNPSASQSFTLTVHEAPAITSGNATTFNVGASGTFQIVASGFPAPTFSETGTLPSGVTLNSSTGVLSGTPASGTLGSYPITITAQNGISPNATQSFTLTVGAGGGQVSGQIFLSNTCGSVTLPTFTVTINTTPAQQAQTDTNGNYSFASVPNGTYTITPSITGASSSVFYPGSYTGVVVSGGSVSGENFNAVVGYNVSGNVSYSGSQNGQTYVYLQSNNCGGGNGGPGTSITQATLTSGGAYTIHGVQPGNYTLYAWMDSTGVTSGTGYPGPQGQPNANDPTGSNSSVSVTNANVAGAGVTMSSPAYSTPNANPSIQVFPNAGGVTIFYNPPSVNTANGNKEEDANEYLVQWAVATGTDADGPTCGTGSGQFATVAGSHTFYAIGAHGATVWILNNTVAGSGTFTSGAKYCFQAQARNTLASTTSPSGWGTYTDSLGNPAAVTIPTGAPSCTGTCTAVSGTVTIPVGVTLASGAPLYVGFYQQNPGSHGPSALYATEITSPVSGANSYSITIPSGSNYTLFGILDQNKDGQIDAGDVTDTNNSGNNSTLTVSGSTMTGVDTTLPGTNSTATVQTQYSSCGTNCSNYYLNLQVREANKLPVAVTLYSGPNLLNPVDMGQCSSCGGSAEFDYSASLPGGTPNVGDTYNFTVTYSDGSVDQGSAGTINGKVTAFGSTGAVVGANDLPTNLSPSGTSSTSTTPNFTWTFPSNPSNYTYSFYLSQSTNCTGNCTIWQIPGQNSNSNGFTYAQTQTGATTGQITWNSDPTGGGSLPSGPLVIGDSYFWNLSVQDANGNQAQASVNYTP